MTTTYTTYAKKRMMTQFFMGIVFIAILIGGWRYPLLGFFIPLCMLSGLGIGLYRGRKWCDWYCPRGSFYDAWMKPLSIRKKIPLLFKDMRFRAGALVLLMLMMAVNVAVRWPHADRIGRFFILMLISTTLLGVILAVLFHQRSWCTVCPIGTVIHLIGKRKYPLYIDSKECIVCKACEKVCPTQISPYRFKKEDRQAVLDGDCLKCNLCVAVCPKNALSRQR